MIYDKRHVKARPRPLRLREQLSVARTQLRAIKALVAKLVERPDAPPGPSGPPRFVAGWSVTRGYSGVTQCLDSAGVVWERHSVIETVDGGKRLKESWWEPLDMTRRA